MRGGGGEWDGEMKSDWCGFWVCERSMRWIRGWYLFAYLGSGKCECRGPCAGSEPWVVGA